MTWRIERFNLSDATTEHVLARYELARSVHQEVEPEEPVPPFEEWRAAVEHGLSWETVLRWSALDRTGAVVGAADLCLGYTESNRWLASSDVQVAPAARRRGLGRALLARAVEAARADGRTTIELATVSGGSGERFLSAVGARRAIVERRSRLVPAQLDRPLLERWVARAAERAGDYELLSYEDRCPDEMLAPMAEIYMTMNTAPHDDLERDDVVVTPERLRAHEERDVARGGRSWVVVARHRVSKELAGFTEMAFSVHRPRLAWQGGTAVAVAHRNRGLGRWLKAANALRLLDERPDVEWLDTWNAYSNDAMLAINDEMGFRVISSVVAYQATVADLAATLARRPAPARASG